MDSLRTAGQRVEDLTDTDDAAEKTKAAMRVGVDVIVQARLDSPTVALAKVDEEVGGGEWDERSDWILVRSKHSSSRLDGAKLL